MASFFAEKQKYNDLLLIVEKWLGASYMHGAYTPFYCTDCVHFVKDIYWRLGVISAMIDFGDYSPDWYLMGEGDLMREAIEAHLNLQGGRLSGYSYTSGKLAKPGDIVCFKIQSDVTNHAGIMLKSGQFVHASTRAKRVLIDSMVAYQQYLSGAYLLECE